MILHFYISNLRKKTFKSFKDDIIETKYFDTITTVTPAQL